MQINNPYLDDIKEVLPYLEAYQNDRFDILMKESVDRSGKRHIEAWGMRKECIAKYGFAIPTAKILNKVLKYSPIIEMGAGTGYWAWLLQQMGGEVVAYDRTPPGRPKNLKANSYFKNSKTWTEVKRGSYAAIQCHPQHTLFLCWPPYNHNMALKCLTTYQGKYFIYIGEFGGCTGDDKFHNKLEAEWEEVEQEPLVQWVGIHDRLHIYKRKSLQA